MIRLRCAILAVVLGLLDTTPASAQSNYSTLVYPGQNGRLIYKPYSQGDRIPDFSRVGYRFGETPLPNLDFQVESNRWIYVASAPGPRDVAIQSAINQISLLATNARGFRGVVQLLAGEFIITNKLFIRTNGVVLRGMGDGPDTNSSTILRSTTTNQVSLIDVDSVGGSRSTVANTTHSITDKAVPVGATSFLVDATNNWAVGHRVIVRRPSPANWISDIGMDRIPQNADSNVVQWAAGSFDQLYERIITRIEGGRVFLDAPLPNAFEQQYGGGTVYRYSFSQRLTQVGIENLRAESAFTSATDEAHAWSFIEMGRVEDCWVRGITAQHFIFAAVTLSPSAARVTVVDAQCLDPKSEIDGGRRYAFNNEGQLNLMRNLFSENGRHDFVNNSSSCGPNVFFNGTATNQNDEAGPHQRWSTGTLFDTLRCFGGSLAAYNRENFGTGHGWSGAQMVFWNCRADFFAVENPLTAKNWVIGGIGTVSNPSDFLNTPAGTYEQHGTNVSLADPVGNPDHSLYLAQLNERLANLTVQTREYVLGDFDQFANDGAGSVDYPPVDAAWTEVAQGIAGGLGMMALDEFTGDAYVPFTFNFQLDPEDEVVGAVLTLALRRTGGTTTNDSLWLERPGYRVRFTSLGLTNTLSTNGTGILIYEFPASALTNFQDGQLNGLVGEDSAVDWAMLRLHVRSPGVPVTTALEPVADAFVRNGTNATRNYGANTVLTVKAAAVVEPDLERKAYLRFDLAGVAGTVVDAKLRLFCTSVSDPVRHAAAFVAGTNWSETGVTWSNAPTASEPFAEWAPQVDESVELPVIAYVLDALGGSRSVSFLIYSTTVTTNGFSNYYSREDNTGQNHRPQLILTISNTPPTLTAIGSRTLAENTSTGPVAITVGDSETGPDTVGLTAASSNPALVPTTNVVFGGGGGNRTFTILPATNQSGTATLTVTATDPQGRTNARAFTLTVTGVNDPPVLAAIANRTVNPGELLVFTNSAADPEVPAEQTLAFSLLTAPAGAAVDAGTGVFTWQPALAQAGATNQIQVRVADNGTPALSATQSFTVTVRPLVAPTAASPQFTNGQFRLAVTGGTGPDFVYTIQTSTNLATWQAVFSTNPATTPFFWMDAGVSNMPMRFYRVILGP